jgi:hypothetical protein
MYKRGRRLSSNPPHFKSKTKQKTTALNHKVREVNRIAFGNTLYILAGASAPLNSHKRLQRA